MNKMMKSIFSAILTLAMLLSFTGCGDSEDIQSSDPVNIAFVVGIADDETKFNEGIDELASLPANPGTDYAFISAEGEPAMIGEAKTIPDFSDRGYTDVMMERVRTGIMADLTGQLADYKPTSSELDLAAATDLGVRTLKAHAVDGRDNVLVYYCSGRSTTGFINMVETPVYEMDVEESASAVAQKMKVDLSGIDVVWYCCGDFGGNKQPKISPNEKEQLKAFYNQLFTALGAKSITFKDDLPSSECYSFPDVPVSPIAVEDTGSELKDLVVLAPEVFEETEETQDEEVADTAVLESPIVIPESQVRYQPDSAEFLDPVAAADAIQPAVDFLLEHPEVNILLYGTCAGDNDTDFSLELGRARAESIKAELEKGGVAEDRITAVTVKVADDPYYQFGLGTNSEASSVNRKCVMLDMSTELAKQILANAV
ncbi:hypothetical protein LIQ05_08065 [Blautia glucerasea]|uniref:hypothetical protein n=1 Tax=Blautia glucerasea TaxID=536633 RepID=UPI001D021DC5|nr:hypothetical protein [Blautia glucerasea]MCB5386944.1 hypothetical protein [Blautia glucerasea]MCB5421590.1 hypothetical protein [Blautia luti]